MNRKWTEAELREWDKPYEGKLNPRATYSCDTCERFYGEQMDAHKPETISYALILDSNDQPTDCFHGKSTEITEKIFDEHMAILERDGLIEPLEDEEANS